MRDRNKIFSSGSGFPAIDLEHWRRVDEQTKERRISGSIVAFIGGFLWMLTMAALVILLAGCTSLRVESATGCGAVSMLDGDRRVIVTHCEGIASECVSCEGAECSTCDNAARVDWGSVVRIVAAAVMSAARN